MDYVLKNRSDAVEKLKRGSVGVMPVDTVYGIVAKASNIEAVNRLYALKQREHKPGTVIAANVDQLIKLGLPETFLRSVAHLWPNPLSIEVQLGEKLSYLHQSTGRQAFRIPLDEDLRNLLQKTGPLVTSSANQPGEPTAETIAEAIAYFHDQVDFYVDGGEFKNTSPSTIIRIIDGKIELVRDGAYKLMLI